MVVHYVVKQIDVQITQLLSKTNMCPMFFYSLVSNICRVFIYK